MHKHLNLQSLSVFAVICIGLALIAPITSNFSTMIYKELLAVIGLIIYLICLFKKNVLYISNSIYILLGLCIIPLIQYINGIIYFKQDVFFACGYLLILGSSIFVGLNLDKRNIKLLMIMLVVIGFISSLMSLNQIFFSFKNFLLLDAAYYGRATANIGQPNQLGTLLIISLCALLYLNNKYNLNKYLIYVYIFLNFFAIYLTQSRTAWLSLIIIMILYLIKYHNKKDLLNTAILSSTFIFISLIIPLRSLASQSTTNGIIERTQSGSSRFKIWPQLIDSTLIHPFTGQGWGQVGIVQMQTANDTSTKSEWFTYSHNLFLDLMVWNGAILGIVLALIILFSMIKLYLRSFKKEQLFLYLALVAFFLHCMLEYPFAYTYFLIITGIIYGYLTRLTFISELKNEKN